MPTLGGAPIRVGQEVIMFALLVSIAFGADADAGKTVYTTSCGTCHGDKGDGAGPVGAALR